MTITIRPFKGGGWEVDIHTWRADGTQVRERVKAPVSGKTAAAEWARKRERILALGLNVKPPVVPTLGEFVPRYWKEWAQANRHRASGVEMRERMLKLHLLPLIEDVRLDEIGDEHFQRIKSAMADQSPRSVNNALSFLGAILAVARRWKVISAVPKLELIPVPRTEKPFYDFDQYSRLVTTAAGVGWRPHLIALLGGRAGLRRGEMIALRWRDVDMHRGTLTVARNSWRGKFGPPKGGSERTIPMVAELKHALEAHRHLKGDLVLCHEDGTPLSEKSMQLVIGAATRVANLAPGIHILRHTFISHLMMRGVPALAVQKLAGHKHLATTLLYAHLSPAAMDEGIRMLETGDVAETLRSSKPKPKRGKR